MSETQPLSDLAARKRGPHLREPIYDGIIVPEELIPVRYVADDDAIKAYCYAVDCAEPRYAEAVEPFGIRLAPSGMVLKELMWLYQTVYDRDRIRGFHQHESFTFHAPIPAGTELILTGRNTEKFTKRGKGYFRHESEARDAQGRLYVSQLNTELVDLHRQGHADDAVKEITPRRIESAWNPAAPIASRLMPGLKHGMRLPEHSVRANRAQMAVFSGAADGFENLHTNLAIAEEMGFADTVVQGLMNVCWLSEQLTRWAGPAWLTGGSARASFLRPMLAGQRALIRSTVSAANAEAIELETTFVNAAGENQAVAFVSLPLRP